MAGEGVVPDISVPLRSTLDVLIGFGADFFAFIVVAAVVTSFAFYFGGDRLSPLIAGIYAAIPLYMLFPYTDILGDTPYLLIGLFALFVALSAIAFSGLSYFMESAPTGLLRFVALSVITAGFIIAVAIHLLPIEQVYTFSEPTKALFASDFSYFWWLAAPIAGLFFLGRG